MNGLSRKFIIHIDILGRFIMGCERWVRSMLYDVMSVVYVFSEQVLKNKKEITT